MPPATETEIAAVLRADSAATDDERANHPDDVVLSELGLPAPSAPPADRAEPTSPWSGLGPQPAAFGPSDPRPNDQGGRHAILRAREAFRERSRLSARASEIARLAAQVEASPAPGERAIPPEAEEITILGSGDLSGTAAPSAAGSADKTAEWSTVPEMTTGTADDAIPSDPEMQQARRPADLADPDWPASPAPSLNSWEPEDADTQQRKRLDPAPPSEGWSTRSVWARASSTGLHTDRAHDRGEVNEDPVGPIQREQDWSSDLVRTQRSDWRENARDVGSGEGDSLLDPARPVEIAHDDILIDVLDNLAAVGDEVPIAAELPLSDDDVVVDDNLQARDAYAALSAHLPRLCRHCRDYRPAETGERGWCANQWAFSHRRMVDAAEETPCESTLGDWWLPVDEVWSEAADVSSHGQPTPLLDALLPHHPERISTRRRS